MNRIISLGLYIILILSSSCTLHRLDVQTQYLTPEYLASTHIATPDPRRFAPVIGQRLLIQWSLCEEEVCGEPLYLFLKVRFRDHEEQTVWVPITSKRGTYLYKVEGERYCETHGILTYYAQIQTAASTLAAWKHPLWVELIHFKGEE